jgi:hypothetical protein
VNIHEAKDFLRGHGYVVVPAERVRTLQTQVAISNMELMDTRYLDSIVESTLDNMVRKMAHELKRSQAVEVTDLRDPDLGCHLYRMTLHVIMPNLDD